MLAQKPYQLNDIGVLHHWLKILSLNPESFTPSLQNILRNCDASGAIHHWHMRKTDIETR